MTRLRWVTRERTMAGRRAPSVLDWLVTMGLVSIGLLEIASELFPGPVVIAAGFLVASTVPVAYRHIAPLPAISLSVVVSLPYVLLFGAGNSLAGAVTLLLLVWSVGRQLTGRALFAGMAMGLLMIVELGIGGRLVVLEDWVYVLLIYGGALGLGVALRVQTERSIVLAITADRAQREQESMAQAAVQEERARIARELHDVVAHNVGLIVLQAGGARSVLSTDSERARTALLQVEETGRQTLAEMRHLVGILRIGETPARQPLPRLDRLPALVDEARAAGLDVKLRIEGEAVELPAGLELAAYRLVQEALTNVRKHAPNGSAQVLLGYEPDRLRIEVLNDGEPGGTVRDAAATVGPGHGLIGMRERVQLYGGRIQVGPLASGGFRVDAVLPVPAAST